MAARWISAGIGPAGMGQRSRQKKSPAERAGLLFVDALPIGWKQSDLAAASGLSEISCEFRRKPAGDTDLKPARVPI